MLGKRLLKIDCPSGRRLVMSNHKAVSRYNKIVEEQFGIHRIKKHLNAMDNNTKNVENQGQSGVHQ